MSEPEQITLDEYRQLLATKPAKRPTKPKAPKGTPKALAGAFENRLARAALNGWYCLESPDCLRYRWRGRDGAVTDFMSYAEATAYAAATKLEPSQ